MVRTSDEQGPPRRIPYELVERLGDTTCQALDEYVTEMVSVHLRDVRHEFRDEFLALHQSLRVELAEVRRDIAVAKAELRQEFLSALAAQKADMMKWMFTFWIGQAAVTVGLILAIK